MELGRRITARPVQGDAPDWRPLEQVLPGELLSEFMWMYELRTPAGGAMHCYKHIDTRCSIHLDADETAFAYVGNDSYRSVRLAAVLREVFESWEELGASREQVAAAEGTIADAER